MFIDFGAILYGFNTYTQTAYCVTRCVLLVKVVLCTSSRGEVMHAEPQDRNLQKIRGVSDVLASGDTRCVKLYSLIIDIIL